MTGALGVETLLPVFAAGTWHTGSAGYGLLRMAPGIAALLAGLGLSMFSAAGRGALTIGIAFAGASAGMAAFAAGPPFVLALLFLAGASLCLAVTQVIADVMIQQAIPDALRGRISALGSAGQNGLAGLGAVVTSGLAATVGPGGAVTGLAGIIACAGIFLALLIARISRRRPALPVRPTRSQGPPTLAPGAHAALKGTARRPTGSRLTDLRDELAVSPTEAAERFWATTLGSHRGSLVEAPSLCLPDLAPGQPGLLPGAGGWSVAVQDLRLAGVPRGGGPVRVQDQGPALLVDHDQMVVRAQEHAVLDAGLAAAGLCLTWCT